MSLLAALLMALAVRAGAESCFQPDQDYGVKCATQASFARVHFNEAGADPAKRDQARQEWAAAVMGLMQAKARYDRGEPMRSISGEVMDGPSREKTGNMLQEWVGRNEAFAAANNFPMPALGREPGPTPREAKAQAEADRENARNGQRGYSPSADPPTRPPPAAPPTRPSPVQVEARSLEADAGAKILAERAKKDPASVSPAEQAAVGKNYLEADRPKDAMPFLDQAIKKDPKNGEALTSRAQSRAALGDREGAMADANAALALDPTNQMARLLAGHSDRLSRVKPGAALRLGAGAEAGLEGGGAASSGRTGSASAAPIAVPDPATLAAGLVRQAEQALARGDRGGALRALSQALGLKPGDPAALALRAKVSNEVKNYAAAARDAEDVLRQDPANVPALLARAFALIQMGRLAEALADADKALSLDPSSASAQLYRAMALEKLGRRAEALAAYEAAAKLDPALKYLYEEALAGGREPGPGAAAPAGQAAAPAALDWRRAARLGVPAAAGLLLLLGALGLVLGKGSEPAPDEGSPATVLETAPALPAELAPGRVLAGTYRVVKELGRGGMGVVFEALDLTLDRRVAIKQMTRERGGDSLERFLREARLAAKLKHPNLVEIHAVINEGELYLVFEYAAGTTLDRVLARRGPLPQAEARRFLGDIASALAYAHSQRVIHRDLKPSNIMVGEDGSCKVMDLGIAHQASSGDATKTAAYGTPAYMAPEQAMGTVSPASDLYALGIVTYEMLVGRRPSGKADLSSGLSPGLAAFFAGVLHPDPARRPQTAPDFLKALDGALPPC